MFQKLIPFSILGILIIGVFAAPPVKADRASSTSFIIESGVIDVGGEDATSTSFRQPSALSQPALGLSTSSGFRILGGFLAFPFVTDPVLSASAGAGQVVLTWTSADGFLGFNVSGYDVGTGSSAGAETFENVGNVLTFTKTGLTAGQTFFFQARAKDEFGEVIATSNEVSATPTSAAAPPGPPFQDPGGGGHGGPRFPFIRPIGDLIPPIGPCQPRTDLNCDGRVNLVDFSIYLYLAPQAVQAAGLADFNEDRNVDIKDLSILLTDWTDRLFTPAPNGLIRTQERARELQKQSQFAVITQSLSFEPLIPKGETGAPKISTSGLWKTVIRFVADVFTGLWNLIF